MRLQIVAFLAAAVLILIVSYFWVSKDITKQDAVTITKLAEEGHLAAQRHLGGMYESGKGIDRHDVKAKQWYEKAAAQNDAHAQRQLGFMYEMGVGVTKDTIKAKEWYERAVKQGEIHAATFIGSLYEKGQDTFPQDYVKAHEWYKQAANKGDIDAQYKLGVLYLLGQGTYRDKEKAIKWFEKAAQDDAYYQNKLGNLYNHGDEKGLFQPQYAKAREWYEKAALKEHILSQLTLAEMYEEGKGIRQDKEKAKEWYGKACDQGHLYGCKDYKRLNNKESLTSK